MSICIPNQKKNNARRAGNKQARQQQINANIGKLLNKLNAAPAAPKAPKPKVRVTGQSEASLGLSHCALKYALAISDPWHKDAQGACVPRHPSRPSQKITEFSRFQITVGGGTNVNASVGAIYILPSLANDSPAILYADNITQLGALPTATQIQALVPFMKAITPNSPYNSSQLTTTLGSSAGPAAQGRIVSSGVSIQYMGSELNMGGIYSMYVSPNHDNMASYNGAALASYDETLIERITTKRQWLVTSGLDETELVYNLSTAIDTTGTTLVTPLVYPFSNGQVFSGAVLTSQWSGTLGTALTSTSTTVSLTGVVGTIPGSGSVLYLNNAGAASVGTPTTLAYTGATQSGSTATLTIVSGTVGAIPVGVPFSSVGAIGFGTSAPACIPGGAPMVIYVQPAVTDKGNVFEVEYVQHVEYIGPITSALHTPTHSDSRGFEVVSTAANRIPSARVESPETPIARLMFNELRQVMAEAAPVVVRNVGNAARVGGNLALRAIGNYAMNSMAPMSRLAIMG